VIEVVERSARELNGGRSERVVNGASQLVADHEVDDERRRHDRERDGRRSDQGKTGTEAHDSRSA
jgi:hypothetical protein